MSVFIEILCACLVASGRLLIALILLSVALGKMRAPAQFLRTVQEYRIGPEWLAIPLAVSIIGAEAILGMILAGSILLPIPGFFVTGAAVAASLLFSCFAFAVAVNLFRGRYHIDCGCNLGQKSHSISWTLVWRNILLAAISVFVSPSIIALDTVATITACMGGIFLFLLYSFANIISHNRILASRQKTSSAWNII